MGSGNDNYDDIVPPSFRNTMTTNRNIIAAVESIEKLNK